MTPLYKILSISVISVICANEMFAQSDSILCEMPDTTFNNTIKDTIILEYSKGYVNFETIEREGGKYYAVKSDGHKEEITSFINGRTRVMVKDGDGHVLVIDKDGNVRGVEEYKKCGGSKALLRENIKEKDSQVTKSGNVKFFSAGKYLFDTYDDYTNAAKGYAERFPSIGEGDYKPAYACAESNTKIEIKAAPYANITFKNERGVPVLCKDGILEVTARGDRDTTSIYAYDADNHIVGKVNVLSYDKVTRKICLVPIGDTKVPDASAVKQELDDFFAKLMVDFDVTIGEPITIQYAKNNIFTHGGSGMIGVYNTDQKAAISKLKERGIDNETVYLFFVKECNALKANDSPDVVNGYMPRGYQFGFIYKELNNYRTIAHEICHGAFHLKHTFDATDYIAPEGATDNLMDYAYGQPKTLNHWQWKDIHQPKSVRFKWLQDESGAESIVLSIYDADDKKKYIEIINGLRHVAIFDRIYRDIEQSTKIFKVVDKIVSENNVQDIINAGMHKGLNGEFIQAQDIIDTWTFLYMFTLFTLEKKAGEQGNEHIIEFSSPKNQEIVNKYIKDKTKRVFANGFTYYTIFEEFFHANHYLYLDSKKLYDSSKQFTQTETEVVYIKMFIYYYLDKHNNPQIKDYAQFDRFKLLQSELGSDIKTEFEDLLNNKEISKSKHEEILKKIVEIKKKSAPSYKEMNENKLDYSIPYSMYLIKQMIK